ncbi:fibroblast growth factor receptor-like [Antedon mediterranea]|uniref:fibroblast growth factor receptor-like n=1 Tax=Antedon mediterranea TaxID=105859 RepID=UPI003AF75273
MENTLRRFLFMIVFSSVSCTLTTTTTRYKDVQPVCNYSDPINETSIAFIGQPFSNLHVVDVGTEDQFLSCCAVNFDRIEWYYNTKLINGAPFTLWENNQVLSIQSIAELSGNYTCVAISKAEKLEHVVKLLVEPKSSGKPVRLHNELCTKQKANTGDNVTFHCVFLVSDDNLCTEFIWTKNGSYLQIINSSLAIGYTTYVVDNDACTEGKNHTRGTYLYIYNLSEESFGEYILFVSREEVQSFTLYLSQPNKNRLENKIIAKSSTDIYIIIVVCFGITAVILASLLTFFCLKKISRQSAFLESIQTKRLEPECLKLDPIFEDLEILFEEQVAWSQRKAIGKGRFGNVFECPVFGIIRKNEYVNVAIKVPKDHASSAEKDDLKNEIEILMQLRNHFNIVEIVACHTKKDPIMLITELLPYGCLLQFLRTSLQMHENGEFSDPIYNIDKPRILYDVSRQIANGMTYVADNKIVHGDLAARNILVGENMNVKIADFGLAKDVYETGYMRLDDGEIPVKWYSIETILKNIVSTKSDIWSYGVLLYEIFSSGSSPYPGIIAHTLPEMLKNGYRMARPSCECPEPAYKLMLTCWEEVPTNRPSFKDLYKTIDSILKDLTSEENPYIDLDEDMNDEYSTMIIIQNPPKEKHSSCCPVEEEIQPCLSPVYETFLSDVVTA